MTTSIAKYSETEAALAELRTKYAKPFDVKTSAGMAEAKRARAEVREYRVKLEAMRVELKAPLLEQSKLLDSEAKRITAALEAIETPIDDTIKKEERRKEEEKAAEEAKRVAASNAAMATANRMREAVAWSVGKSSKEIGATLEGLQAQAFIEDEHRANLELVRGQVREQLSALLARVVASEEDDKRREKERAELVAQQAKLEADKRKADEERAAADAAAAKARAEADRAAREVREKEEARLRAERAKLDGERDAAAAIAQKMKDDAETKARAERAAAEEKARKVEEEKQRKLRGRELLRQFVTLHKADAEFKEIAEEIAAFLEATNVVQKKAVGK